MYQNLSTIEVNHEQNSSLGQIGVVITSQFTSEKAIDHVVSYCLSMLKFKDVLQVLYYIVILRTRVNDKGVCTERDASQYTRASGLRSLICISALIWNKRFTPLGRFLKIQYKLYLIGSSATSLQEVMTKASIGQVSVLMDGMGCGTSADRWDANGRDCVPSLCQQRRPPNTLLEGSVAHCVCMPHSKPHIFSSKSADNCLLLY